ncbi:GIY-YIG nuclease family protein [Candidatus Peregrinibacteria bacterium]|nr:GIY-YIG nuclease family protein [Candidatus Peregrinibacteria bacterium]
MPKFTKATKFNKTNIDKIPDDKSIVYRLRNQAGKELYTGIAKRYRGKERLLEHINLKSERIKGAVKVKVLQVPNIEKAEKIEKKLIEQLRPKFNIQNR